MGVRERCVVSARRGRHGRSLLLCGSLGLLALSSLAMGPLRAAVPPNIEAGLRKIGPIVDPACTAVLYRPLMPKNDITSDVAKPYPGITVVRNQSFGPAPLDAIDIFTADKGPASRTVLIYVPGGAGNKIELQDKEANAFYDNIGRWATQHGMVEINMQRHSSPTWDGGARDISRLIQWLQGHIAEYGGNPNRMFIWAHSAGNVPVGTYIGHPELYGPNGVGVKGVIFMSAAAFDILPARPPPMGLSMKMMAAAGQACDKLGSFVATAGALPGMAPGQPGGPPLPGSFSFGPPRAGPAPGAAPGGPPAVDPATQLARSSLPELKRTTAKIMLANGEMDIGVVNGRGGLTGFNKTLDDALCAAGPDRCPTLLVAKGHSHMSLVFSIGTADTSVSGPVLAFINGTP